MTASPNLDAVRALDLESKVRLLTGASMFTLASEPRIGLRAMSFSDGPTGVRGLTFTGGRVVALLPNATLLASSWSAETAFEVGEILAEEALAQQIHVVLGPTINLHRTLLGGRLFEAYSEDPLLTGVLAAAYVNGMQSRGIGACLKHLVANESETLRNTVNSVVDEATLRELYLLPFEIAVTDSDPWSMMAAYNDVNGVAATEHDHVINGIVKGEWGYPGLVMSDWFATKTAGPAANGGLDLVMPGPMGPWGEALVAAVTSGEVDESVVDDHLRRLLVLAGHVGATGLGRDWPADLPAPDSAIRRMQLTRLAASGMTVLTNRDDTLPLSGTATVALIGRHALETSTMGGGSARVDAPHHISVAEGLAALMGEHVTVTDGVEIRTRSVPARSTFVTDPHDGEPGIGLTILDADGNLLEQRHSLDGASMVGFDDGFIGLVGSVRIQARLVEGGRVSLGVIGAGHWSLSAAGRTVEIPLALAGTGMGEEVLNPPRETVEFVVEAGDLVEAILTISASTAPGPQLVGLVGLIASRAPRDADDVIREAAAAASGSDIAVVVVGLTDEQETEAVDKHTLRLPGRQDDLVAAVAAVARRTVVVVNSATPVLMPWLADVDAVLWAGLPGQEGGHAVAAALLGTIEPAGRLVTTFPVADGAAPTWDVDPVDGDLVYAEGTFIGYRGHHARLAPAPAFWFGHGLGYSTWGYAGPRLLDDGSGIAVTVTNTGARASREVVQVYFRPDDETQPVRLVGWSAVTLEPAAAHDISVVLDRRMWRRWDVGTSTWHTLPDAGQLLVARGLGDVRGVIDL
jgi:beta-glucosidase